MIRWKILFTWLIFVIYNTHYTFCVHMTTVMSLLFYNFNYLFFSCIFGLESGFLPEEVSALCPDAIFNFKSNLSSHLRPNWDAPHFPFGLQSPAPALSHSCTNRVDHLGCFPSLC